jgi:transposase
MPSMQLRRDDVIVGVYTHKDEHVAVVLDGLGGRLGEKFIPATAAGFADLLTFCHDQVGVKGRLTGFGVEGTGSYGMGLARFLRRLGHTVHEVHRPPRKGERRMSGKSDTIDAEHAARQVLGGSIMAVPKTADGQIEALRLLKIARDTAVKAQTTAMITLKATLVTASDQLRAELEPLTDHKLILACAELASAACLTDPDAAMRHVLGALARRWLTLHEEVKLHSAHLKAQTKAAAPQLVEAVGVGFDIAAEMLVTAGDNRTRIRSEAAFAKMCGACPIPGRVGQDQRPAPAQPRRQPAGQCRALPRRHRPHALAPTHHRLRHPTHQARPVQARDHPLSQTLPCPRDLPPLAAPPVCRRGTRGTPAGSGLTT